MIRIRRGDFVYSDDEINAMVEDIRYFKSHEADGIVFGCLDKNNQLHVQNIMKLADAWGFEKPITFHRAFDETDKNDFKKNIAHLAELGIRRILSSGFEASAELGIENLKEMVSFAKSMQVKIMPGAGINKSNTAKIISETGCDEIHASARSPLESSSKSKLSMGGGNEDLQPLLVCDPIKVKEIIEEAKSVERF
jgi:copper homeostasis protein